MKAVTMTKWVFGLALVGVLVLAMASPAFARDRDGGRDGNWSSSRGGDVRFIQNHYRDRDDVRFYPSRSRYYYGSGYYCPAPVYYQPACPVYYPAYDYAPVVYAAPPCYYTTPSIVSFNFGFGHRR